MCISEVLRQHNRLLSSSRASTAGPLHGTAPGASAFLDSGCCHAGISTAKARSQVPSGNKTAPGAHVAWVSLSRRHTPDTGPACIPAQEVRPPATLCLLRVRSRKQRQLRGKGAPHPQMPPLQV